MRINSRGQVTIPQWIRERAGLLPATEVDFVLEDDGVRIVRAHAPRRPTRGQMAVAALRRARGQNTLITDEIMTLMRGDD